MANTGLPALFSTCRDCKAHPVVHTRQRAIGARPAGRWFQACSEHIPGSGLRRLPVDHPVAKMAATLNAHEVVTL